MVRTINHTSLWFPELKERIQLLWRCSPLLLLLATPAPLQLVNSVTCRAILSEE